MSLVSVAVRTGGSLAHKPSSVEENMAGEADTPAGSLGQRRGFWGPQPTWLGLTQWEVSGKLHTEQKSRLDKHKGSRFGFPLQCYLSLEGFCAPIDLYCPPVMITLSLNSGTGHLG